MSQGDFFAHRPVSALEAKETREKTSHRKKKWNFICSYTYQHFEIKTYNYSQLI